MNKLQTIAKQETSKKLTENGAFTYNTLNSNKLPKNVELFSIIGALRERDEEEIINKFACAANENIEIATKLMFYCGNIRGGLGERRIFRICLKWLAKNYPSLVEQNLRTIPHFNRWDSLFELIDTPCETEMWNFIASQLVKDINNMGKNKQISLLAKWMPSENTSSKQTKALARKVRNALDLNSADYRLMLSELRKYINVVEVKMSSKNWKDINYETVPSRAMMNYKDAFDRHDMEDFNKYLESVKKGEKKINAFTLYPYDLVKNYLNFQYKKTNNSVIEEQWKALPNYIEDESNILVMADVSGSMIGRPMETSIGLAIYFAERNKGLLKGTYMTFTNKPHFQYIDENDTLENKVLKVRNTDIGYSTNLEAAFDYLLKIAIENNFTNKDMPEAICVISDMEINPYMTFNDNLDFIENQRIKYQLSGYKLPKLILWNVEARQDTFLTQQEDVINVSGSSTSTFKSLIGNLNGKTTYDVMIETLFDKIYDIIEF